jgi:hypothetical protein
MMNYYNNAPKEFITACTDGAACAYSATVSCMTTERHADEAAPYAVFLAGVVAEVYCLTSAKAVRSSGFRLGGKARFPRAIEGIE